ncbi:MAG: hypothetical protein RLP44_28890 [Aggregatilineales bacterium]
MTTEIPIQCVLDAIPEAEREAQVARSHEIFGAVQNVHETSDGYRFTLPIEKLITVATWVSFERLCCPFFAFGITFAPAATTFDFALNGGEEVKAFIRHEIVDQLIPTIS